MGGGFLLTSLWLYTLFHSTASRTLCSRIFFKNIDENQMPYKMIEGVFVKQSYNHSDFPVYKRENGNLFFYLDITKTAGTMLNFGKSLGNFFGVGARVMMSNGVNSSRWLNAGTLDRKDVFGGLISQWFYYDLRDRKNYPILFPMIEAVCVEDDFRECNSDKVYMDRDVTITLDDGQYIIKRKTDYFQRIRDRYLYLRPVYRHIRFSLNLEYTSDGYWVVKSSYSEKTFMKAKDLALRPQYITNTWMANGKDGWYQMQSFKIRCKGITRSTTTNKCPAKPCADGAACIYTADRETLCICPPEYTGTYCGKLKSRCSNLQKIEGKELGFNYIGKNPDELAMTFCNSKNPSQGYAVCSANQFRKSYWSRQGPACRETEPLKTDKTPDKTHDNTRHEQLGYIPDIEIIIFSIAILLQVFFPLVLCCCGGCVTANTDEEEEAEDGIPQVEPQRIQTRASAAEHHELEGDDDQAQGELIEDRQLETEMNQLRRKRGKLCRKANCCRLLSMHMYFTFLLWLSYYLVCRATECTQYGTIFEYLRYMSFAVMGLAPLIVLIESSSSNELQYIQNIMEDETAWDYIQRIQAEPPVITMAVECYHMEARTRTVSYTNSSGQRRTRTETYHVKVVTHEDRDTFKYGSWRDESKKRMPELSKVSLTRLKMKARILFGNQETHDDFVRQKSEMLERNSHRDEEMKFHSNINSIPGYKKRIVAYVDLSVKPFWIRKKYFWLATFMWMTWPYRWLFRAETAKNYFDFKKMMYKSPYPPGEEEPMPPMTSLQQHPAPSAPMPSALQDPPGGCHAYPAFEMTESRGHSGLPPPPAYSDLTELPPTNVRPSGPPPSYNTVAQTQYLGAT